MKRIFFSLLRYQSKKIFSKQTKKKDKLLDLKFALGPQSQIIVKRSSMLVPHFLDNFGPTCNGTHLKVIVFPTYEFEICGKSMCGHKI